MKNLLNLTPAALLERGMIFEGQPYREVRSLLSELAEYSDNDQILLLDNIKWAVTKQGNWLWESKFKDMPIRKIVEIVAMDHNNNTNSLQS